ncbi:MAG TPA: cbb3-type cytochrome c oxidase subunit II [Gemmataceae bacterium]|nr:cbb3-type cytochrome c oxidase subunit II [Gemmataceae bacterium]
MFERKSGILLLAGLGFFALAFVSNGLVPWLMYAKTPEQTLEDTIELQLAAPDADAGKKLHRVNVVSQFKLLAQLYHESFDKHHDGWRKWNADEWKQETANAIRRGHKAYVAEACWHCHSQFIRPVSNESRRWGPVSKSAEYNNELQRPVLFGTRRVGPDLTHEGGRRSNDWHAAHFFRPRETSPLSVMPDYPWFFDGDPGHPNERGIGIITYMQWLGSTLPSYPDYGQY